jgi:predicted O-methyltransferase YrrM
MDMMKALPGKRYDPETTELERKALCRLLKTAAISAPHLEIGTAAGATLTEMMASYSDRDRPKFVVVDTFAYFENQLEAVRENLSSVGVNPDTVDFRMGFSDALFRLASENGDSFGFIFIDGNHKIDFVTRDLRWTRLLQPGGYLCLHDYSSVHPGVILAVDRFLRKNKNYVVVEQADSLMIIKKNSLSERLEIDHFDIFHSICLSVLLHWKRLIRKRMGKQKFVHQA